MPFEIEFYGAALRHLRGLTARQRAIVINGVRVHLATEPLKESRNRKPRRPNLLAPMELRLGNLRIYYEVSESFVIVLAIGVKIRERVLIDGEDAEEL